MLRWSLLWWMGKVGVDCLTRTYHEVGKINSSHFYSRRVVNMFSATFDGYGSGHKSLRQVRPWKNRRSLCPPRHSLGVAELRLFEFNRPLPAAWLAVAAPHSLEDNGNRMSRHKTWWNNWHIHSSNAHEPSNFVLRCRKAHLQHLSPPHSGPNTATSSRTSMSTRISHSKL